MAHPIVNLAENISNIQTYGLVENWTEEQEICEYEKTPYIEEKFYLIAVFGSFIMLFGIVTNSILLTVLLKKKLRETYLIYLAALSVSDIGLLIAYFMVFSVQIMYDYFELLPLYFAWLYYIPYFYAFSRIMPLASSYLTVVCSAERFLEVIQVRYQIKIIKVNQRRRYYVICAILVFSFFFRIISIWDLELEYRSNCTGFESMGLTLTSLARNNSYKQIYQLWTVQTVQIFFPFVILVVMNALTSMEWRRMTQEERRLSASERSSRMRVSCRSARQMMIAIVTTYLISNALNVVITLWEHADRQFLLDHIEFYTYATDCVSLLVVLNSSLRLPIYYFSNWRIREQLNKMYRRICCCKSSRNRILYKKVLLKK
ncbi:unnamed protein product [Soboliphyme baturini]|uniref:G_PROTEIN_RECEP_F1_2 domain-containing protein n=1 Tax=Soboliphyme baturini TaxID=241478 RepID=A0A183IGN1_9BILA|nr:unnamed protein product [Soboliphyme baturini]